MRIAFCTTCKDRVLHLEKTLPANLANNPHAVHIVLSYNCPGTESYLRLNHGRDLADGRLVVYSLREHGVFQMAHAKNVAHRCAIREGADVLVNLDADNYAGDRFDAFIADMLDREGKDSFLWSRMIPGVLSRGISGRIVVPSPIFLTAGGYDERFRAWGRDDKEFNERLTRLGFGKHEVDPSFLDSVRHNDKIRFKEYPHAKRDVNEDQAIFDNAMETAATIANFGSVGRGVVHRNFEPEKIVLPYIPTRIFGIGLHKTGTTSLHRALQLLGFRSAHWKSAHWAKAIWRDITTLGRSHAIEQQYAVSDLPVGLLYRQLDQAYPHSKFILTTRNETTWLESVRRHWDPATNIYRAGWDTDPFSHKLHQMLYGRQDFDPETFLARYRRHTDEVLTYFRHRPQDLLVLDLDYAKVFGWSRLGAFLDRPIPQGPYPHEIPGSNGHP